MEKKIRTTVYLERHEYRLLKQIAAQKGSTAAGEIREAIAGYIASEGPRPLPRSLGAAASRRGDLSESAEDLLRDMGKR
ncbi:MAG TPA: hypothetical protein VM534_02495 [Thermoanaerobaculia bacterium]|nr:hypothetical protein [Thermoanaerobaculia bacterium]